MTPQPLPPPLASEGSESPSVVRGAGGRCASLPSTAPQTGGLGRSCRVKGPSPRPTGCGPHQPLDPSSAGQSRPCTRSWPGLRFLAGGGVKGTPGGRMRSAAEGEHRTGEDVGEAVPLMPLEAIQPFGKGEVKGNARRACPRSQSGKNRRGMQPEGGCPSGARSRGW